MVKQWAQPPINIDCHLEVLDCGPISQVFSLNIYYIRFSLEYQEKSSKSIFWQYFFRF